MDILEFTEKLNELGVRISGTNVSGREKKYPIGIGLDKENIIIKDFQVTWEDNISEDPLKKLIQSAIDMDTWKHSLHEDIFNYDKIQNIIQNKILKRAKEIEFLLTVYFQINHEKTKYNAGNKGTNPTDGD